MSGEVIEFLIDVISNLLLFDDDSSKLPKVVKIPLTIIMGLLFFIAISLCFWYAIFALEEGYPKRIAIGIIGLIISVGFIRKIVQKINLDA